MAVGDIPASLQDTQQIGGNALYSKSVRVSDTIIAVAYTKDGGATSKLAIYTYAIDASGNIGNNLDSYVFTNKATGALNCGNFFRVRGDIFAVFSYDTDNSLDKSLLRTFDIDSASGEITLLDDEIITTSGTREPTGCLVNATTGIIALARCNTTKRQSVYVETRAIDENGVIGTVIDSMYVDDTGGALQFNEIIYDAEYSFLIGGYSNSTRTAGIIWSLSCDSSGNLGAAFTDTMAINTKFLEPSFTKITTGVYACICMGADTKMEIKSFTLASNGLLPASVTDTLVLSATASGWVEAKSSLVEVATGYYTYGFKSNDQVFVGTCTIGTNGAIGNSQLDTLAVTSTTTGIYAASMKVVKIKSGIFAIAYEAHDDDDTPYEAADYVNLATYLVDTGETVVKDIIGMGFIAFPR